MIDLTTYALLRKQIATAASGISDVRAEGDELVFVLADGHEVRVAIPATEIRDAVVRDDVLVLTLEDDKEVVVDDTLTQSGQAADAKVTGEEIGQLKDDLGNIIRESDSMSDLDISDSDGNVLARFENGHFKTRNFNSEDISNPDVDVRFSDSKADFDISDAQGNVIASFYDGHVRTKNFDSAEADTELSSKIYGKTWRKSFEYVYGSSSSITMDVNCKKGDLLVFHLVDGVEKWNLGNVVSYYANGKLLSDSARGNGYFQYKATEDVYSVGVAIGGTSYIDSRDMAFELTRLGYVAIQPNIVTVKQDGTGDFTSIRHAVDSIVDANAVLNPYVIEVYEGTYNVLNDYTDDEIRHATDAAPYTFVGVKLTDGISMRGVGMRENVILHGELDPDVYDSTIRKAISTINLQGNSGIENLTVSAKNLRYCVHDDFRSCVESHPYKRIVKNCVFWGKGLSNIPMTTYGAGMGDAGMDAVFEDCDFNGELLVHTQSTVKNSCTITVRNCSGIRFRIGDNGGSKRHNFSIHSCKFDMIKYQNSASDGLQHITVNGTGNEHAMVECDSGILCAIGSVRKVPLLSFDPGTVVCSRDYTYDKTSDVDIVSGIVIGNDERYTYVQRVGYVNSNIIGISGLSVGDYLTVNNAMIATGGTKDNAIGIVTYINPNNVAFIKLLF